MNTPWGPSQTVKTIAPGVQSVTTASHGGLKLSDEVWAKVRNQFPKVSTYAPDNWLEEDLDWSLAALACPELFPDRDCFYAVQSTRYQGDYFKLVREWMLTPAAEAVKSKAAEYKAEGME